MTINICNAISQYPSYDSISITPQTWKEIDIVYYDNFPYKSNYDKQLQKDCFKFYKAEKNKVVKPVLRCEEHVNLLRPKKIINKWIKKQKRHGFIKLNIPEFGVDNVHAYIVLVKPIKLDTSKINWSKQNSRPVIGTFKRYTTDVRSYTFKDEHGNVEKINATPNHPFYVKNKNAFVPIEDVEPTDKLVSETGNDVRLLCLVGKSSHCGERYNRHGLPVFVYNLEVYRKHVYYVGNDEVLVHNMCNEDEVVGPNAFESSKIFIKKAQDMKLLEGETVGENKSITSFNAITQETQSMTDTNTVLLLGRTEDNVLRPDGFYSTEDMNEFFASINMDDGDEEPAPWGTGDPINEWDGLVAVARRELYEEGSDESRSTATSERSSFPAVEDVSDQVDNDILEEWPEYSDYTGIRLFPKTPVTRLEVFGYIRPDGVVVKP